MKSQSPTRYEPEPFWQSKSLSQMTRDEWEALCDGCGRCCLEKLEDEDTGDVYYTNVACDYLDISTCRCKAYERRISLVTHCMDLTPDKIPLYHWLPKTCAYRLVYEAEDLHWWHPLISGDPQTVHDAGMSIREFAISAKFVKPEELEAYVLDREL